MADYLLTYLLTYLQESMYCTTREVSSCDSSRLTTAPSHHNLSLFCCWL